MLIAVYARTTIVVRFDLYFVSQNTVSTTSNKVKASPIFYSNVLLSGISISCI